MTGTDAVDNSVLLCLFPRLAGKKHKNANRHRLARNPARPSGRESGCGAATSPVQLASGTRGGSVRVFHPESLLGVVGRSVRISTHATQTTLARLSAPARVVPLPSQYSWTPLGKHTVA